MSSDPKDVVVGPERMTREGLGSALRTPRKAIDAKDGGTLLVMAVAATMIAGLGIIAAATLGLMVRIFCSVAGLGC